jgi:hypothetical protein
MFSLVLSTAFRYPISCEAASYPDNVTHCFLRYVIIALQNIIPSFYLTVISTHSAHSAQSLAFFWSLTSIRLNSNESHFAPN